MRTGTLRYYFYICLIYEYNLQTMINRICIWAAALMAIAATGCKKQPAPEQNGNDFPVYTEPVPDTTVFTNAEFLYNGDDIGEALSDGWVIKFYTDMEIDEAGAPIGPGEVMQLLLNVTYDENQSADASLLTGKYSEMLNSGNFSAGTFVSGYMTNIDLPGGERLSLADATYYGELEDGSTEIDYDLIDEGVVRITGNDDGTYSFEGILVGSKYTKRYFKWTGNVEPRNNVPEEIPNSTLRTGITNLSFAKGRLIDKGDCFFLGDQSYRCLLLFLVDETAEFPFDRPTGTSRVLRIETLVPWETDFREGIPAGTYEIAPRNPDTSMDRDKIVPGIAVAGLPDVFAEWKMSGTWYYEMTDGNWSKTYARIAGGSITVARGNDGSHTISYDLADCQENPKRITGSTFLETIDTYPKE